MINTINNPDYLYSLCECSFLMNANTPNNAMKCCNTEFISVMNNVYRAIVVHPKVLFFLFIYSSGECP